MDLEVRGKKAGSFDIDKLKEVLPGIELTTAPEGYVKVHEIITYGPKHVLVVQVLMVNSKWSTNLKT